MVPTSVVAISFLSFPRERRALYVADSGYCMIISSYYKEEEDRVLTPWSPGVDGYESYERISTVASPGYQSAATEFQIQIKLLSPW